MIKAAAPVNASFLRCDSVSKSATFLPCSLRVEPGPFGIIGHSDAGEGRIPPRKQPLEVNPLLIAKRHKGVPLEFSAVRHEGELDRGRPGLEAFGPQEADFRIRVQAVFGAAKK